MNISPKFCSFASLVIGVVTLGLVPVSKGNPPPPCVVVGNWTCSQQLSPNTAGVLDRNVITVCVGQSITPPYLTTQPTFNNGSKSRVITINCPAQGTTHTETIPVRYVSDLTFTPAIPASFGSVTTFNTTAKVTARPVSLLLWWKGENASEEFGANNVTAIGGVTYGTAQVGNGFVLNGQTSYLQLANTADLRLQNFTIEMWVKRASATKATQNAGGFDGRLFSFGYQDGYSLGILDNGQLYFTQNNSYNIVTPVSVLTGTGFRHVAVTKSGSMISFYVDGVLRHTATYDQRITFNSAPAIGGLPGGGRNFWGTIDEVSFYSCPLSLEKIQQIYMLGLPANGNKGKCLTTLASGGCGIIPTDCACSQNAISTLGTVTINVGKDLDNDQMLDCWEITHFGNFIQSGDGDYDRDGTSNIAEHNAGTNPNDIKFETHYPQRKVNTTTAVGKASLLTGTPIQMAVLVDTDNYSSAVWQPYQSTFNVNLGNTDGKHVVRFGLRGVNPSIPIKWSEDRITLDRVAPIITVTNPNAITTSRPVLQLQGAADERLASLTYDIANAFGSVSGKRGFVVDQYFDPTLFDFTTNYFHCFDIPLAKGQNTITLRATDMAGNTATLVTNINFSVSGDVTPPSIQVNWPQNGMSIAGDTFYVRGKSDDGTARVTGQVVAGGNTIELTGLVERDGWFWITNLALLTGDNIVSIKATDAGGNFSVANLTVTKSSVALAVTSLPSNVSPFNTASPVSGTIISQDQVQSITVNGSAATLNQFGNWTASNPTVRGRTMQTFDVAATISTVQGLAVVNASVLRDPGWYHYISEHNSQRKVKWTSTWNNSVYTDLITTKGYTASWSPDANMEWVADFYKHWTEEEYYVNDGWSISDVEWSDEHPNGISGGIPILGASYEAMSLPHHDLAFGGSGGYGSGYHIWHYYADQVSYGGKKSGGGNPEYFYIRDMKIGGSTRETLKTGGKLGSTKEHLFRLYAYVGILNEIDVKLQSTHTRDPYRVVGPYGPEPIDASAVTVGGLRLGNDGIAWAMLPDNSEMDITVIAPEKHFEAWAEAQKLEDIDLDVDSDNDGTIEYSDLEEDNMEEQTPGKFLLMNDGDADNDSIPDFADGFDPYGTSPDPVDNDPDGSGQSAAFTPMMLQIPSGVDITRAKVKFVYSASNPGGVTRTPRGNGTYTYTPAGGGLRIWAKDGPQFRKNAEINQYKDVEPYPGYTYKVHDGDFVASGTEYWATNLTSLFIEGIHTGNFAITVYLDPDAESGFIAHDQVVVTVIGVDLDVDSDNNNEFKSPDRSAAEDEIEDDTNKPGKIIVVNDDDSDADGIPDFADFSSPGDDKFVPLVLEIPASVDVNLAQVQLGYSASDPAGVFQDTQTPPMWQPSGGGHIRIWKKKGNESRTVPGDYLAPGNYTAAQLGFTDTIRVITNYVEGIRPSATKADQRISVNLDVNGTLNTSDAVRLTCIKIYVNSLDKYAEVKIAEETVEMLGGIEKCGIQLQSASGELYALNLRDAHVYEPRAAYNVPVVNDAGQSAGSVTVQEGVFFPNTEAETPVNPNDWTQPIAVTKEGGFYRFVTVFDSITGLKVSLLREGVATAERSYQLTPFAAMSDFIQSYDEILTESWQAYFGDNPTALPAAPPSATGLSGWFGSYKRGLLARMCTAVFDKVESVVVAGVTTAVETVKIAVIGAEGFGKGFWAGAKSDAQNIGDILKFIAHPVDSSKALYEGIRGLAKLSLAELKQIPKKLLDEYLTEAQKDIAWLEPAGASGADLIVYSVGYGGGFVSEQIVVSVVAGVFKAAVVLPAAAKVGSRVATMMSSVKAGKKLLGTVKDGQDVLAKIQKAKNSSVKAVSQFVMNKTGMDKAEKYVREVLTPNCNVITAP